MNVTEALKLINQIEQSNYKPNEWETKFLENVTAAVHKGKDLSPKQGNALSSIIKKILNPKK